MKNLSILLFVTLAVFASQASANVLSNTKIYLGTNDTFSISSSGATIYGSSGNDTIKINSGVTNLTLDQNIERIILSGKASDYQFKQTGNKINIYDASGTIVVTVPLQSGGTTFSFADLTTKALLSAGVMTLGGTTVTTAINTVTPIITTITPTQPTSTSTTAKVYLGTDESFTVSSSGTTLYGNSGNEIVTVAPGVLAVTLDQNVEQVNLSGAANSYTFKQTGNKINVYDATGATVLATIPVQSGGTTLSFTDGTVSATLTAGVMTLGGNAVSVSTATRLNLNPTYLTVTPKMLTFPTQTPGTSSTVQTVTVTNTGTSAINSLGVGYTIPSEFVSTNNCGKNLAAGASCTISVTFSPKTYNPQTSSLTKTDTLSVSSGTSGGNFVIQLSGTVPPLPLPSVSISPASLTFAAQDIGTKSAAQTVTVTNTGNAPLNIFCIDTNGNSVRCTMGGNTPNFVETNNCKNDYSLIYPPINSNFSNFDIAIANLAVGANCTISVIYAPQVGGVNSLRIFTDAANNPNIVVPLNVNTCTYPQVLQNGVCVAPALFYTGHWVGTWQWSGPSSGCAFTDGGAFTMFLEQSGSSVKGSTQGDGIQSRNSNTCILADTFTEYGLFSGTLTSSFVLNTFTFNLGNLSLSGSAVTNGNIINGTFVRDTGGHGTFTVTKQ